MLESGLLFAISLVLGAVPGAFGVLFYPNPQASLLEHILVDAHGAHSSGFVDAITPCKNYVNGAQTLGRETVAQWLRVAFHDFVTAHVVNGTGGMDASIGFETLRTEDSGAAMNDSLSFFRPFVNPKVSSEYLPPQSGSPSSQNFCHCLTFTPLYQKLILVVTAADFIALSVVVVRYSGQDERIIKLI
jgi:hypothetical protein